MKEFDNQAETRSRAVVYKLLSDCYYPPDERTRGQAERLLRELRDLLPEAETAIDLLAAGLAASEGVEELAVDHARLFVGPFALLAPPYGSIYLEGERRLMGDSTLAANECYREVGLEVAADFNETPDHIAAELEFMHFLAAKELEARGDGDSVRARHYRRKQTAFLERHLAAWVPAFSRSVEEHAQTSFYRDMAAATRLFIQSDVVLCRDEAEATVVSGKGRNYEQVSGG